MTKAYLALSARFLSRIYIMLLLFCSSISFSQEYETISWSSDQKLRWEDYTGELDPDVFASAKTSYKIAFIPENVLVGCAISANVLTPSVFKKYSKDCPESEIIDAKRKTIEKYKFFIVIVFID